ncbi:TadE/TadG family type IV pilus assembly protein [Pseudovibrio brasiliensis]|uniref:TadE/TadG family type IV pilus assembly protein n=1 Tax=Pseudovibrio brasiliensis TaxID=1898042 RepID=UPI001AD9097A|nr:TadE/TadG family type IV pilus assembly protein [Pseudovibrio brasiliensis]
MKSFFSDWKGATAIEFGLIAPILFAIVFSILELGLSLFVEVLLDNAVAEAARQIRTGQVHAAAESGEYDQASFKKTILENGTGLLKAAEDRILINVESFEDFGNIPEAKPLVEDGEIVMNQNWDPGGTSDVVLVRVICSWPMITSKMIEVFGQTSDGMRILVATEIFRNEPF